MRRTTRPRRRRPAPAAPGHAVPSAMPRIYEEMPVQLCGHVFVLLHFGSRLRCLGINGFLRHLASLDACVIKLSLVYKAWHVFRLECKVLHAGDNGICSQISTSARLNPSTNQQAHSLLLANLHFNLLSCTFSHGFLDKRTGS